MGNLSLQMGVATNITDKENGKCETQTLRVSARENKILTKHIYIKPTGT